MSTYSDTSNKRVGIPNIFSDATTPRVIEDPDKFYLLRVAITDVDPAGELIPLGTRWTVRWDDAVIQHGFRNFAAAVVAWAYLNLGGNPLGYPWIVYREGGDLT